MVWNKREAWLRLGKGHGHSRSRLDAIVLKHVWDQLFTVDTIWNIGETGDMYGCAAGTLSITVIIQKSWNWP